MIVNLDNGGKDLFVEELEVTTVAQRNRFRERSMIDRQLKVMHDRLLGRLLRVNFDPESRACCRPAWLTQQPTAIHFPR